MKNTLTGILIVLALVMTVIAGTVALADDPAPGTPAVPEASVAEAAESDALQDALKAYSEAQTSSREESLEAELKACVESGKLTQEQADLILNYYKEQQALRDGVCPNCGCRFRDSQSSGRMNGGFGGRGGCMNGGRGGRGAMGQMPSGTQDGANAGGASFTSGPQSQPDMTGSV